MSKESRRKKRELNSNELDVSWSYSQKEKELWDEYNKLDKSDPDYEQKEKDISERIRKCTEGREKHEKTVAERKKHKRNIIIIILNAILGLAVGILTIMFPFLKGKIGDFRKGMN